MSRSASVPPPLIYRVQGPREPFIYESGAPLKLGGEIPSPHGDSTYVIDTIGEPDNDDVDAVAYVSSLGHIG